MDIFTKGLWIITFGLLVFSFIKDRGKTLAALKKALAMGRGMILSVLAVIFTIGFILAVFPAETIAAYIESQHAILATVAAAAIGTITLIPAFIAFPLIQTLLKAGVGIMPAVAVLTTLTMVGVATMPLERRTFGTKFTLVRNGLSFVFAIVIALVMGVIL